MSWALHALVIPLVIAAPEVLVQLLMHHGILCVLNSAVRRVRQRCSLTCFTGQDVQKADVQSSSKASAEGR